MICPISKSKPLGMNFTISKLTTPITKKSWLSSQKLKQIRKKSQPKRPHAKGLIGFMMGLSSMRMKRLRRKIIDLLVERNHQFSRIMDWLSFGVHFGKYLKHSFQCFRYFNHVSISSSYFKS